MSGMRYGQGKIRSLCIVRSPPGMPQLTHLTTHVVWGCVAPSGLHQRAHLSNDEAATAHSVLLPHSPRNPNGKPPHVLPHPSPNRRHGWPPMWKPAPETDPPPDRLGRRWRCCKGPTWRHSWPPPRSANRWPLTTSLRATLCSITVLLLLLLVPHSCVELDIIAYRNTASVGQARSLRCSRHSTVRTSTCAEAPQERCSTCSSATRPRGTRLCAPSSLFEFCCECSAAERAPSAPH